jgi:hypothetical protein
MLNGSSKRVLRSTSRLFGVEIEDRSAIERRFIVAMRIEHGHGGIIAKPGQRRGDKGAAFVAEITPVISS